MNILKYGIMGEIVHDHVTGRDEIHVKWFVMKYGIMGKIVHDHVTG